MRKFVTHRNQNLTSNDVNARYFFRNGVFNLHAWIDFDEINLLVFIHQKFDRSRARILNVATNPHCIIIQFVFSFLRKRQGRRNLDDLLKPPLHGTITLVKMHQIAVSVAQNLDFNVLGIVNKFFKKNSIVPEGSFGFTTSFPVRFYQIGFRPHDPHTSSATARSRLHHQGKTNPLGFRQSDPLSNFYLLTLGSSGQNGVGNHRHIHFFGNHFCRHFIAHFFHRFGVRTNENDAFFSTTPRKIHVFGQKTVAGVNRFHTIRFCHPQNFLDVEVRTQRLVISSNLVGFVGFVTVERITVFIRKNGNGREFQFRGGTENPNGNFAPIGDHELFKTTVLFGHN